VTTTKVEGRNAMPKVVLSHPSGSSADIYLNGAHVTSWIPAGGHEMLFLSEEALFDRGKPIRGGIPVVFPQFADSGPLPKHGWLRTSAWTIDDSRSAEDGSSVALSTSDTDQTRAIWPYKYSAGLHVTLDETALRVELTIQNTGSEAFEFTSALHTYLSAGDVTYAELVGLEGVSYVDRSAAGALRIDRDRLLRITAETDRIYLGAPSPLRFVDCSRDTTVEIAAAGFPHVVVWNPWERISRTLPDMSDDEYVRMICVEAALAGKALELSPGASWSGSQRLTVL